MSQINPLYVLPSNFFHIYLKINLSISYRGLKCYSSERTKTLFVQIRFRGTKFVLEVQVV
jgi:hypothetical protein